MLIPIYLCLLCVMFDLDFAALYPALVFGMEAI
jgi:hypothetical protein